MASGRQTTRASSELGAGNGERALAGSRVADGEPALAGSRVADIQRARLLRAALEAIDAHGYMGFTVAHVIKRAKVSRKTFYEVFADREACFAELFEQGVAQAERRATEAYVEQSSWREGVRSAVAELLVLIDEQEALARLCIVESLAASPRILQRRLEVLQRVRAVIELGRSQRVRVSQPAEVTAEGAVGAVLAVVHGRLVQRSREPYIELAGQLTSMLVLPYLGATVAARELARPLPVRRERAARGQDGASRAGNDPLAGMDMRLTYRTVRVLKAIAEREGPSNREVADAAGISDQGQMSKLLARLERLELVQNIGDGLPRGAPNRWRLTARGEQLERSTRSP